MLLPPYRILQIYLLIYLPFNFLLCIIRIKKSKSEDILLKDRLERLTSSFERFIGDLKDTQLTILKAQARLTLSESRIRFHIRTLRQMVFI